METSNIVESVVRKTIVNPVVCRLQKDGDPVSIGCHKSLSVLQLLRPNVGLS